MMVRVANTGNRKKDWSDRGHGRAGATTWTGEHHTKSVPLEDDNLFGSHIPEPGRRPLMATAGIETTYNT